MNASTKNPPKKQTHYSFSFYVNLENQNLSQTYILLNFPFMTLVTYSSTYSAPVNTGQHNIPQTQNRLLLWQFLDSLYLGCSFSVYQIYIWLITLPALQLNVSFSVTLSLGHFNQVQNNTQHSSFQSVLPQLSSDNSHYPTSISAYIVGASHEN